MIYENYMLEKELKKIRKEYPEGTRVRFLSSPYPYSPLKDGDKGTVSFVDDAGTVHVKWDKGCYLGLLKEDIFKKTE